MKQVFIITMALAFGWVLATAEAQIRYPDVIYVDDLKEPELRLTVLRSTGLLAAPHAQNEMASLVKGQKVLVLGLGSGVDYVETTIVSGRARGWVDASAIEQPSAELVEHLKKSRERVDALKKAIERHEVMLGMTQNEVQASLGDPTRKVHTLTKDGEADQWVFISYKMVPVTTYISDAWGNQTTATTYQKVSTGQKTITFQGDSVVAVADEQGEQPKLQSEIPVNIPLVTTGTNPVAPWHRQN